MKHIIYLLFTLVFAFEASTSFAADNVKKIGIVGAANPALQANSSGGTTRDLSTGDPIYFGDTIATNDGGNAQLIFADKSTLTIAANSSVTIDSFIYDPKTQEGDFGASMTKGTFRFIGGALSKKKPATFKTPVATIGIHGSSFTFDISPSGSLLATGQVGEMSIQNLLGETTSHVGEFAVQTDGNHFVMPDGALISGFLEMASLALTSSVNESAGMSMVSQPNAQEAKLGLGDITLNTDENPAESLDSNPFEDDQETLEIPTEGSQNGSPQVTQDSTSIANFTDNTTGVDTVMGQEQILFEVVTDVDTTIGQEQILLEIVEVALPPFVAYNVSLENYIGGVGSWGVTENFTTADGLELPSQPGGIIVANPRHASSNSFIAERSLNAHVIAKEVYTQTHIPGASLSGLDATYFDGIYGGGFFGSGEVENSGPVAGAALWGGVYDNPIFENVTATYEGDMFGYFINHPVDGFPDGAINLEGDIVLNMDFANADAGQYAVTGSWNLDYIDSAGDTNNPTYANNLYDGHLISGTILSGSDANGTAGSLFVDESGLAALSEPEIAFRLQSDFDTNGNGSLNEESRTVGAGYGQFYGDEPNTAPDQIGGTWAIGSNAFYRSQETDGSVTMDTRGAVGGFRARTRE